MTLPPQLESILDDIQRCLDAQLYYPAILISLTLPEICCGLLMPKAEYIKMKHYAAFVDKYTTPADLSTDGADCYRIRCGLVHRGNAAGHDRMDLTHIIFTVPESAAQLHAFTMMHVQANMKAGMIDAVRFCNTLSDAVRAWYADHHINPAVDERAKDLLSWRPEGVPPLISGTPVVASGP